MNTKKLLEELIIAIDRNRAQGNTTSLVNITRIQTNAKIVAVDKRHENQMRLPFNCPINLYDIENGNLKGYNNFNLLFDNYTVREICVKSLIEIDHYKNNYNIAVKELVKLRQIKDYELSKLKQENSNLQASYANLKNEFESHKDNIKNLFGLN